MKLTLSTKRPSSFHLYQMSTLKDYFYNHRKRSIGRSFRHSCRYFALTDFSVLDRRQELGTLRGTLASVPSLLSRFIYAAELNSAKVFGRIYLR
jgi:hypothetical protein